MAAKNLKFHFNEGVPAEVYPYEDTYTEEVKDFEALREQNGVVVWCKHVKCFFNKPSEGVRRTTGTLLSNQNYNPINEQEHIWTGLCTRKEIGIDFKRVIGASGAAQKVPSCFTESTRGADLGHIDFAKLLQPNGTPYGGSIESQNHSW